MTVPSAEIERVFAQEYGRAVSVLVRVFGDIDIAQDAVQDAFIAALEHWPAGGLRPGRPAGSSPRRATGRSIGSAARRPATIATRRRRCSTRVTNRSRRAPCATIGSA
jgi:RNA polymerase sigma-70 factor (ECF subfamily)